jgi:serine/threonine-protein kinase RsbW
MRQTRHFEHAAASVTAARRFVARALEEAPPEVREAAMLMVSELASNCVRHTDGGFELTISRTRETIRVEASDCGVGTPTVRHPEPSDPSGRGLQIIDMLSEEWGYASHPGSAKTVWFTLSLTAPCGALYA